MTFDFRDCFDPDGPEVWRAPDELAGPTRVPAVNLAVSVLANDIVGNDITEAAGLYLIYEAWKEYEGA